MARTRKLTVEITGETKGLSGALQTADRKVGGLGSKFSKLSSTAKVALAGVATAVVAFGKSSVDAYVEAEKAQARLSDAYKKFPQLANGNIEALRDLNSELAKTTRFDDDVTASSQAILAQFKLTEDQLIALTPLMQDYAAKTGKDLNTAATDLGKAILGQGRALKAVGIEFKDTGTEAGNFEALMKALNTQVGGFAEKEGKTAAGQAEILKNQFGELQEEVGSFLVPALQVLVGFITNEVVPKLQSLKSWAEKNEGAAKALAAVVGGVLFAAMTAYAASAAVAAFSTMLVVAPYVLLAALAVAAALGTQFLVDKFHLLPRVSRVVNAAIHTITRAVELLISALRTAVDLLGKLKPPSFLSGAPGVGWGINTVKGLAGKRVVSDPELTRRASGGPVMAGRQYLVGERGPELLTMGANGHVNPNIGGGQSMVFDLRGAVIASEVDMERVVRKAIQGDLRRNGRIAGTNIVKATA